jgi:catechol 2,3-dioxygenase
MTDTTMTETNPGPDQSPETKAPRPRPRDRGPETRAQTPTGLDHLVLNVRDLEASHRFWTELLGFRHVATSHRPGPNGAPPMRFYSGECDGKPHHHDLALVEAAAPPSDPALHPRALNHVAVEYPTQAAWRKQIAFLTARGVKLHRHVERGVTHSIHLTDPDGHEIEPVHELPRQLWEHDIDAALNQAVERPIHQENDQATRLPAWTHARSTHR